MVEFLQRQKLGISESRKISLKNAQEKNKKSGVQCIEICDEFMVKVVDGGRNESEMVEHTCVQKQN